MSLEKNRYVKRLMKNISIKSDGTIKTTLTVETYLVLDAERTGYDADLFRTLSEHIVEYLKAHNDIDGANVVQVDAPR